MFIIIVRELCSSLYLFNLIGKLLLLALVTEKSCSDLLLLCTDYQHLFLQHHAANFVSVCAGKKD